MINPTMVQGILALAACSSGTYFALAGQWYGYALLCWAALLQYRLYVKAEVIEFFLTAARNAGGQALVLSGSVKKKEEDKSNG